MDTTRDSADTLFMERSQERREDRRLIEMAETDYESFATEMNQRAMSKMGEPVSDIFMRALPRGVAKGYEQLMETMPMRVGPTTGMPAVPLLSGKSAQEEANNIQNELANQELTVDQVSSLFEEPKTAPGQFVEPVAQFFAVGGPAAGVLKTAGMGAYAAWLVGGGLGDATAFDPDDPLLSDMLFFNEGEESLDLPDELTSFQEENPQATQLIAESLRESLYLSENQSQALGRVARRLQMAGEGAALGWLFEGAVGATRAVATQSGREGLREGARWIADQYEQAVQHLSSLPRGPASGSPASQRGSADVSALGTVVDKVKQTGRDLFDSQNTALGRDTERFQKPEPPAVSRETPAMYQASAEKLANASEARKVQGPPEPRTKDRNINMNYIETMEDNDDVARILDEVAEQNKGFEAARRGRISTDKTMEDAKAMLPWEREPIRVEEGEDGLFRVLNHDGTPAHPNAYRDAEKAQRWADHLQQQRGDAIDMMLRREPGDMWNAEQVTAARIVLANSADEMQKRARWLVNNEAAASPADWLEFRRMAAKHSLFQQSVQGAVGEIGRAMRALQIPAQSTGQTTGANYQQIAMEEILQATGGVKTAKALANKIASAKDLGRVSDLASKGAWAKSRDVILQVWINGLLSSPVTHAKNMLGNTMANAMAVPERFAAAGVGSIRRAITGADDGVRASEAMGQLNSYLGGWADGIRLAGRALKTGEETLGMGTKLSDAGLDRHRAISATEFGVDPDSIYGKGVDFLGDWVVGWPGRALMAEDELFKGLNYRMELGAQAYRKASQEGLPFGSKEYADRVSELLNEPTEDMYAESMLQAQKMTFTDPISSDLVKSLQGMTGRFPMLKFVMPFVRTPFNIAKYSVERSPLAWANPKWWADVKAGGARADMAIGKLVTGSGILGAASYFTVQGNITGAGPKDPSMNKVWRDQGYQPWSIRVGDYLFSYNGLDPVGMQIGMMAQTLNAMALETDPEKQNEAAFAAVLGVAESLTSKSYMQGMSEMFEILSTDWNAIVTAKRSSQNLMASMVPRWVTHVTTIHGDEIYKADDAANRQEFLDMTGLPDEAVGEGKIKRSYETGSYWGDLQRMIGHRSGYLSNEIPPRVDVFGRPILMAGSVGPDFFMPTYKSKRKYNPLLDELMMNNVAPSQPRAVFSYLGGDIDLHNDVHDERGAGWALFEYQVAVGRRRAESLQRLVGSDTYKKAPRPGGKGDMGSNNRAQLLRMALAEANERAKLDIIDKYELQGLAQQRAREPDEMRTNMPFEPLQF